jgi:hypothetical protein
MIVKDDIKSGVYADPVNSLDGHAPLGKTALKPKKGETMRKTKCERWSGLAWGVFVPIAFLVLFASSVAAKQTTATGAYWKYKKQCTTREAFLRAEARLARVQVGMTDTEFLEAMEALSLVKDGRVVDLALEGYLCDSSTKCQITPNTHFMVFGYKCKRKEVPISLVVIVDHKVAWIGKDLA